MTERRVYLVLALLMLPMLLLVWPIVEVMVGIVLLLGFTLYAYVTTRLGLPPILRCGEYCGR